jgi:hypothetical protein
MLGANGMSDDHTWPLGYYDENNKLITAHCAPGDTMTWQPISSAPKDGTLILLWLPKPVATWGDPEGGVGPLERSHIALGWYDKDRRYFGGEIFFQIGVVEPGASDSEGHYSCLPIKAKPTHWMPLPQPPEEMR